MRILVTLIVLFMCTLGNAQTKTEEPKNEAKILKQMASQKAIELQKELNLTIRASKALEKSIFNYSLKANKILQSNVSAREKSKSLSNLIYFQNEELKKLFTVDQFYKYLSLQNAYVAGY
ncbi:hypothetical protein U6A24_05695 [Aquimarina gracilis]|uniref:TolC family protein n=1 Tax=Aquimarina gracilis TaxID=874422 RepID=A0ABU5ZTI5_9FLAO|nr:hypothetical protein [Aquimarina gracilis]MEB3344943.1 hypothetical protein [Aquimarina gracilis]